MCPNGSIKKILIADDEEKVVRLLEKALQRQGFVVVTASDGQEAKDKIIQEQPHMILLDLKMPRANGWEVLRWLREEQKCATPAIIISAKDDMEDIKKSYALAADHYILKPVRIIDVLKSIQAVGLIKAQGEKEA